MIEFRHIWTPILVVTGAILNLLTIKVFCRRKMRKYCVSLSMISLAVSDTTVLTIPLLLSWIDEVFFNYYYVNHTIWCNLHGYADLISSSNSSWIIILISIERWYAVCRPWEKQRKFTNKRVLITLFGLFSFSLVFFSYFPLSLHRVRVSQNTTSPLECQLYRENAYYFFGFISVIIVYILPFLILFYFNLMIIFNLRLRPFKSRSVSVKKTKSKKNLEISEYSVSQIEFSQQVSLSNSNNHFNYSKNDRNLSITLVTVAFTFMSLTFPFQVYWFYENIYLNFNFDVFNNFSLNSSFILTKSFNQTSLTQKYFKDTTFLLKNMNYFINFFLYSALSKLFREEFLASISEKKLFRFIGYSLCCCKIKDEVKESNGSSFAELSFSLEAFKQIKNGNKNRKLLFQMRIEPSNFIEYFRNKNSKSKNLEIRDSFSNEGKNYRTSSTQTIHTTIKQYKKPKGKQNDSFRSFIVRKKNDSEAYPSSALETTNNFPLI
ncbi:unnamed protein product [Brachionus calyciflorus]|uniref:G-protein coupled receptors family 1 profile domain-containing protein n=1 Tax=Brachionus calyciflorus TaxID=104777 RepID=A0A813MBJ3_9BILA|nr:unnamed protein product [Brachionus calyciflorus]